MNNHDDLLKLAAILNYVFSGFLALGACFPVIHLTIGTALLTGAIPVNNPDEAQISTFVGGIFIMVAAIIIILFGALALLTFTAARAIADRRRHTLIIVVSGIQCLFMPFGTFLGVFTIWLLMQDDVKTQFGLSVTPTP